MRLRSVELAVPHAAAAADFLESVWGLVPAGVRNGTRFLRGSGDHPYIFSLTQDSTPSATAITFAGPPGEIDETRDRALRAAAVMHPVSEFDVPGGGAGFVVQGPEGQIYQFISETSRPSPTQDRDQPIQITHAVLNATSVASVEKFVVDALGFRVSDRTRLMTFIRCNKKHHSLAYAHSDVSSLNHIAFEMQDIDAVMRGFGRMRDAGFETVWGPGRHGPGNNVFGYFIAPFGAVIEYTTEVAEVDEDYRVGSPEDWKWPPGRIDHWGISRKEVDKISVAERAYRFRPSSHFSKAGP